MAHSVCYKTQYVNVLHSTVQSRRKSLNLAASKYVDRKCYGSWLQSRNGFLDDCGKSRTVESNLILRKGHRFYQMGPSILFLARLSLYMYFGQDSPSLVYHDHKSILIGMLCVAMISRRACYYLRLKFLGCCPHWSRWFSLETPPPWHVTIYIAVQLLGLVPQMIYPVAIV